MYFNDFKHALSSSADVDRRSLAMFGENYLPTESSQHKTGFDYLVDLHQPTFSAFSSAFMAFRR